MKKKLSGALALGLAFALTFSMTAFAADSKDTGDQTTKESEAVAESAKVGEATITLSDGTTTTATPVVAPVTPAEEEAAEKAADSAAAKETTVDGATYQKASTEPITFDIAVPGTTYGVETKLAFEITIPALKADTYYYVAHKQADGKVDVQVVKTDASKKVALKVNGLSLFTFIELEKAGTTTTPATSTSTTTETTTTAATAPKTGETLPVAGIAAVIALAGLAVGAKKVRVNR